VVLAAGALFLLAFIWSGVRGRELPAGIGLDTH
jgi:hypothetical protein